MGVFALSATFQASPYTPSLTGIHRVAVFPQAPAPTAGTVCHRTPLRQGPVSVDPARPTSCHSKRGPSHSERPVPSSSSATRAMVRPGEGKPLAQSPMASKGPAEAQNQVLWMPKATCSVTGDTVSKLGLARGKGVTGGAGGAGHVERGSALTPATVLSGASQLLQEPPLSHP